MRLRCPWAVCLVLLVALPAIAGPPAPSTQPTQVISSVLSRVVALIDPPAKSTPQTFSGRFIIAKADGLPAEAHGASLDVAYQAPDHLRLVAHVSGQDYLVCRDGEELWTYQPGRHFGVIGKSGLPLFSLDPKALDQTTLAPFHIPLLARAEIAAVPMLSHGTANVLPDEAIGGEPCRVVSLAAPDMLTKLLHLPAARIELAVRESDDLPARLRVCDGRKIDVEVRLIEPKFEAPWPEDRWKLQPAAGDHVETVAISHLTRFLSVARKMTNNQITPPGPSTGQRKVVAKSGDGRLEQWDGTRVLFVKGTPQAMGKQQGTLLKKQIKDIGDHILYGVGVGSSFLKGSWFFGDIERAAQRLAPFISPRYTAEMDAMASAAGVRPAEMRLANVFPELFHCSGFAVMGDATVGGHLYHGRVLDYLKGVGLEQNAVVTVYQPDQGYAWVNIGYAGFIGSVTAMNEKHIAIGEMGGRGEGNWDGRPMAQLVREVMEHAATLDEAIDIMRKGPRTCEYYYVISDGNTKSAVAIEATPTKFVTLYPGQWHPLLPHPIKDTVLISGEKRYEKLVERVNTEYGKLDMEKARALMNPPVAMKSNIQSVLFEPETLDFWVANADGQHVASESRYTHYNLGEMLASR